MAESGIIVGLDIGTTKICAVVGELVENDTINIIGIGLAPSHGMNKGVVTNIAQTVQSIQQAIADAERMAGCEIHTVYVGIAGSHIDGITSNGAIAIKGGEVMQDDVRRVLEAARTIAISPDREVIHVLPQEYKVDSQTEILDPIGMSGVRLEAKVHIVTGEVAAAQNIVNSCLRADLGVSDIVLEALASSKAILTREEREIGAVILDIGGGTSDMAVFAGDSIKYTAVVPLGGDNLTKDIAFGLRTPVAEAEKLKITEAHALASEVRNDEFVEVASVGGREPTRLQKRLLAEICEPRMEEILTLANEKLIESGCKNQLAAGVVLTGGTSLIRGCRELAEQIFNMPVRIGSPYNVGGLREAVDSPKYATAVGLLRYGVEKEEFEEVRIDSRQRSTASTTSWLETITVRMKKWFSDIV